MFITKLLKGSAADKILFLLIILSVFLGSGCTSLRKKFVRKKKYQKEAPVYVDFKDYPTKPSRDVYIDYYLFVRGWLDELTGALERGTSNKKERRAINEAIMNLEQIISFYNTDGKDAIYPLYEELLAIRKEVETSPNMADVRKNALIKRIEYFKRRFEKDFNYKDAEKWLN